MLVTLAVFLRRCALEQEDEQRVGVLPDGFDFVTNFDRLFDAFNSTAVCFVLEQLDNPLAALLELLAIIGIAFEPVVIDSGDSGREERLSLLQRLRGRTCYSAPTVGRRRAQIRPVSDDKPTALSKIPFRVTFNST